MSISRMVWLMNKLLMPNESKVENSEQIPADKLRQMSKDFFN